MKHTYLALLLIIMAGLSACKKAPPATVFIPPTPAPTATLDVHILPSPTPALVSATPACTNNLTFEEDVSIPDGSIVAPGSILEKQWRVSNQGTCNWGAGYHLTFKNGDLLGAEEEQSLFPARAGADIVIAITFTAPDAEGSYFSEWQAVDPQGNPFGDPIFINFVVSP